MVFRRASLGQRDSGIGKNKRNASSPTNLVRQSSPLHFDEDNAASRIIKGYLREASERVREVGMKFLVPGANGYIMKSDFLEWRLESKGWLIKSFTSPLQYVEGLPDTMGESLELLEMLTFAVAVILFGDPEPAQFPEVEAVLRIRLQFPWLSQSSIAPLRLAIVQDSGSILPARRRWKAASSLGIKLVLVTDRAYIPGEEDLFKETFDEFVKVDMNPDERLGHRIASALRPLRSRLDGIFAPKDHRLRCTTEAAKLLGLFTSPLEAYKKAEDKFLTRETEPEADRIRLVEGFEQIDSVLSTLAGDVFPVVVKPCRGETGQCVAKVSNERGLREALQKALAFSSPPRALIEQYVSGPEVDVNYVLLDGKVLFGGVCDNFPTMADRSKSDDLLYFPETKNMSPSGLPWSEQELLVNHLHQTLLRQGFRTGVFHVEGRVKDSAMEYRADDAGVWDLQKQTGPSVSEPSVFLHEINARPPGFQACAAFMLSFGIDFWAAQMLCAAKDWNRLKALMVPLPRKARDQLAVENLHCPVSEAAVTTTFPGFDVNERRLHFMGDPMPELREYNTRLNARVVQCQVIINAGEVYGGSGWLWLATFVVAATRSRRDALEMTELMVQKYRAAIKSIDGINSDAI